MTDHTDSSLIELQIVYPSAQGPATGEFEPTATVRQVKEFALQEFKL